MQQQKNLMLFTVLSFGVLFGWMWLQQQLWPPPKKNPQLSQKALEELRPNLQAVNLLGQSLPLASADDPLRMMAALSLTVPHYRMPPVRPASWSDLASPIRKALLLAPPPLFLGPEALVQLARLGPLLEPPPTAAEGAQTIALGGPKHHMQALLTTRGAGVRRLTLNKFQAADWLGRPEYKDESKKEERDLELIQDDAVTPSFLLYHYADPKADRPVLTLGEQLWKLESKTRPDDDIQEVRFSAPVPGHENMRLHKTYRLEAGTYHIGLTLEIVDERDAKIAPAEASRFRYQLAGAHGLPIEGEWYTSAFRSAVVGVVDNRNNLWRDLEDSARISHRDGGDRVPEANLGGDAAGSMLQYAGVMTQYFGSMIVVDDKQAKAEEGGVDPRKILAYARPTLESTEIAGQIVEIREHSIVFAWSGKKQRIETYELLPRVVDHLKKAEFKEGDHAVLSYYQTPDGRTIATWVRRGRTTLPAFDDVTVRVMSQEVSLRPGERVVHRFLLYHGPAKPKLLGQFSGDRSVPAELVDRYTHTLHLRSLTDYGKFYWWTDLIVASTNIMHSLLYYLRFMGDGLSIILLTVLVRGLMFPISRKQAYFSVKMQELAPEIKKIQEKYKNDAQGKTEATMELYRKHKVHPLGGCLPLVLQMPIFIGLYFALQESIFFRLAPFMWISNLAAPDMLIYWGESIPIISDPSNRVGPGASFFDIIGAMFYLGPYLNLLPIVASTLMIVQQKVMTPPPQDEQQAAQFKMMRIMMGFMGLMFYKVAAGLCIYFIASSLWGLSERQFLPKKKTALPAPAPTGPGSRGPQKGPGLSGRKQPSAKAPDKKDGNVQKARDWWQEVLKQARKR